MDSVEDRVANLECNQDEQSGVFDVMRAEIQGIKYNVNNPQRDVQTHVEFLENRDSACNIKLPNLPEIHGRPWTP